MMVVRGVKEYLFRAALHEAGRRPFTPIAAVMDPAIYNATWVATLWTSIILLAAMLTIRELQRRGAATVADVKPRSVIRSRPTACSANPALEHASADPRLERHRHSATPRR